MRMLMLALVAVVIIVGTVGTPKAVLAQDCDLCKFENEQHQFEGTPELCTEENRGENPVLDDAVQGTADAATAPVQNVGVYLLDPAYLDFRGIQIGAPERVMIDPRLLS